MSWGGSRPGAGRPKGSKNRLTRDMRAAIYKAFQNQGGVAYLERVAENDPKTFCALLAKLLPNQATVDVATGPVKVIGHRPLTTDEWAREFCKPEIGERDD